MEPHGSQSPFQAMKPRWSVLSNNQRCSSRTVRKVSGLKHMISQPLPPHEHSGPRVSAVPPAAGCRGRPACAWPRWPLPRGVPEPEPCAGQSLRHTTHHEHRDYHRHIPRASPPHWTKLLVLCVGAETLGGCRRITDYYITFFSGFFVIITFTFKSFSINKNNVFLIYYSLSCCYVMIHLSTIRTSMKTYYKIITILSYILFTLHTGCPQEEL